MQILIDKPPIDTPTDVPSVAHLFCRNCNPGDPPWKAYCGYELKEINYDVSGKCVVCLDMEGKGCPNGH